MISDRTRADGQRGAALLIVLLLVATLATLALTLTDVTSRTLRQAQAAQARDQAVYDLLGAERAALLLLARQEELSPGIDTLNERWLAAPITVPLDGRLMTARFNDRSACFNINDFVEDAPEAGALRTDADAIERFGALVEALGGRRDAGQRLAQATADFIDTDGRTGPGGAEDLVYTLGPAPYRTPGTFLASVSEVRAVRGWSAATYRTLRPFLCARSGELGAGTINVNTLRVADAPLLVAALDPRIPVRAAAQLIEGRPESGWTDPQAVLDSPTVTSLQPPIDPAAAERVGTAASLIEFSASAVYGTRVFTMTSQIERSNGGFTVTARRFGAEE